MIWFDLMKWKAIHQIVIAKLQTQQQRLCANASKKCLNLSLDKKWTNWVKYYDQIMLYEKEEKNAEWK